jgi:1-acyl-sn-glycerol-3-phosphate acyltransferase
MIRGAGMGGDPEDEVPPSIREQVGTAAREVVERLAAPLPSLERPGADDGTVVEAARELFSSDYYLRQWGRVGMRNRSEDVDEFGYDPTYEQRFLPIAQFLYQRYFRVEVEGVDRIPEEGRCLIVANHSGTIPLDGIMLRMALRQEHPAHRPLRWLAEDYLYYLPFAGSFITRIGAVRACQENAERLLTQENVVAAFPEGVKGIGKLFKERYRLQRFGRGGFIRLCLRTSTPIVPCAIVGAEETGPMLARAEYVARVLGLPYIPITPTFPLFGPLGLVPAPTKWRITFGEPVSLAEYGRKAADDHVLVGRLTERVRANIQRMLDETVDSRSSVWLG